MYPLPTEGKDVQKIAAVLEELEDWEALAQWLDITRATINNINKNCGRAQCQWRELVKTYCDGNGGDPRKAAVDIANILSSKMGKKKQAQILSRLEFTSELYS